jgi:hypothetical protein
MPAMPDAKILGTAHAWNDGEQWWYVRSRADAPEDAVEVQGLNADGQLVLHHFTGAGGTFIYGAKLREPT